MNALCPCLVLVTLCQSVGALWPHTPFQAVNYLLRYGYLNPDYSMRTNPSKVLFYAVKNFQMKSSLNVTGEMDKSTFHQMQKKRCGVPDFSSQKLKDIFQGGPEIRIILSKRDATQAHWDKTDLTYYIKDYTQDLSKEVTDETIKKALQVWADVSKLTFTKASNDSADIVISFVQGVHGDGSPFDGPGGILAHAYFPKTNADPLEGDAHFDEDETWIVEKDKNGTNLFCTAVHEFGHSLGLSHTYYTKDVMFPFDTDCNDFRLSENDIATIQQLYGKPGNSTITTQSVKVSTVPPKATHPKTTPTSTTVQTTTTLAPTTTPTTVPTTPLSTTTERPSTPSYPTNTTCPSGTTTTRRPSQTFPELCQGSVHAITYGADGNLYVFKDYLVFTIDPNGIIQEFYMFIFELFPRAPNTVDAAFTVKLDNEDENGHASFTYLIQSGMLWKYYFDAAHQQFQLAFGYPHLKYSDFPHPPHRIGASFYADGITYLIDRGNYVEYRYNNELSTFEVWAHPRLVGAPTYLQNVPSRAFIDAAWVTDDHHLNLFIGDDWYVIDSAGVIRDKFKTVSFFGCEVVTVPDRDQHSYHGHRHSPHRRKHSPHRGKHSPHRGKHTPHRGKHSPRKGKHSRKKQKKSKKDKHRRRSRHRG